MKSILLAVSIALLFSGCTKKEPSGSTASGNRAANEPEQVILEAEIDVTKKYLGLVQKNDMLIWDLKDESGAIVSGSWGPVPKLPYQLIIRGKNLHRTVAKDSLLVFSARIIKFGEESKPPKKGQLQVMVGMLPPKDQQIVKPAVSQKVLDKYYKKSGKTPDLGLVAVGAKVRAELAPATM